MNWLTLAFLLISSYNIEKPEIQRPFKVMWVSPYTVVIYSSFRVDAVIPHTHIFRVFSERHAYNKVYLIIRTVQPHIKCTVIIRGRRYSIVLNNKRIQETEFGWSQRRKK